MKRIMLSITTALICCVLLMTGVTGCGEPAETTGETTTTAPTTGATPAAPETTSAPETITVTDGFGREVTVTGPVNTVASGISTVTELVVSLGAKDRIVAIDCSTAGLTFLFHDLLSLPLIRTNVDNHYDIDLEKLISLEPDVFITDAEPQGGFDALVAALEPEIPVIAISYDTPGEIVNSVTMLGDLLDCREAADEYIAFFQGTMDMITERTAGIAGEDKPQIYYEMMPYYTFSKDLSMYQIQIEIPGGVNAAADMPTTYGTIDPEWVIERNPDIIVSMAMPFSMMGTEPVACGYEVDDYSEIASFRESILNRSELSEVTAIKEGRVYVIHYELPTISCIGFAYMSKCFYPELFDDLDPQALHQEWLTRFMGIDYDLEEHGVFFYPEP